MEIAASKSVSKQQVIDVIAETQVERQIEADKNNPSTEQLLKAIEPKVLQVIEHKTETPW